MTSIIDSSVHIHTSAELAPCSPPWLGEVVLLVTHLKKQGVLTNLCERVRFAWRRFGRYEVIDFLAVLFGYAIRGTGRSPAHALSRGSAGSPTHPRQAARRAGGSSGKHLDSL